jgi:ubiquinone/menaquinone biosynthesis C-methylase UbiE
MKKTDYHHTSWHNVGDWYNTLVDKRGHYYHQHIVIPGVLKLLALTDQSRVLDVACGQGVLARTVPKKVSYVGIDIAASLITFAKDHDHQENHEYYVGDVTKPLPIGKKDFSHAVCILALQNIEHPELVIENIAKHSIPDGILVIVLNHPCFRIPRQSGWGIDEKNKLQYRKIFRYLSPLKIPITTHPGQDNSPVTWSFHQPLSSYIDMLHRNGFVIENLEEWSSDKISRGTAGKMENRARAEIPLFLAIRARKNR